jgi:hypothetical protein
MVNTLIYGDDCMTFEEAKSYKQKLEEINNRHSAHLNTFERNALGMTPDHIRATSEWKQAKFEFDQSFTELRKFNAHYVKKFKKEIQADRRMKFKKSKEG